MKTKNVLALLLAILVSTASFAQKGSVTKADAYLTKSEIGKAKAEIDVAITIEKVARKSKTWFTRGKIYQFIAISDDEAVTAIDAEALQKAVDAYNKVKSMEKESSPNYFISDQNLETIWGNYINKGGEFYGEGDYETALTNFEKALVVRSEDSLTLLYSGVAAHQMSEAQKTLKYYYKLFAQDQANVDVLSSLIYLERTENKDDEKALEIVTIAKGLYPKEQKFSQEEISLLLTLDKIDEAKTKLETAIAKDPSNANLYLNLGVLYDNLGNVKLSEGKKEESRVAFNSAKDNYLKVIEIEDDNFVGNFNLGVLFVNLAKEYYDEVRDMDLKAYDKYGSAKVAKADKILKEGLPYMEKAVSIQPDDVGGLKALQQMYTQLKMYDKAEAVMDKIEALEGGN